MGSPHETSDGKRKSRTRAVIFLTGSAVALTLGGVATWFASQDNTQGMYRDLDTGQWDWWHVAMKVSMPLVAWVLLFALFGGFRKEPDP